MRNKNKKPQAPKKPEGRPQWDGKDHNIVIQKLEQAWSWGCSDAEACFFADISVSALFDYICKHPEVSERREALKNKPILAARQSVLSAFKENPDIAFKYLERKQRDEFMPFSRFEHTGKNGSAIEVKEKIDFSKFSNENLEKLIGNISKAIEDGTIK